MALGGVPTGKQNASPEGMVMIRVKNSAEIPVCATNPKESGIRITTAAALLIASVMRIDNRDNRMIKSQGDNFAPPRASLTSQSMAWVSYKAFPKAMAPPYITITPQLM